MEDRLTLTLTAAEAETLLVGMMAAARAAPRGQHHEFALAGCKLVDAYKQDGAAFDFAPCIDRAVAIVPNKTPAIAA